MKALFKILLLLTVTWSGVLSAKQPNVSREVFLQSVFGQQVPQSKTLWLTKETKQQVEKILHHPSNALRYRYWQQGEKSVWIMNEIGKEKPITIAVVLHGDTIEQVKILAFRESRGWEVQHKFFTKQYVGVSLNPDKKNHKLSKRIDGITGATLSVNAVNKVARIALFLQQQTRVNG